MINGHGTLPPPTDICQVIANARYHENRDENKHVFHTSCRVTRVRILTLLLLLLYALNPDVIDYFVSFDQGIRKKTITTLEKQTHPPLLHKLT